jgi:hypothetical protein
MRLLIENFAPPSPPERKRVGPYSRGLHRAAIGQCVDGRSREGRFLRAYEAMLSRHVGNGASSVQRALITRAARLALYVEMMDERALSQGGMSERDSATYLAWSNSLRRTLVALGIEGAAERPPSLADVTAQIAAAKREGHAA